MTQEKGEMTRRVPTTNLHRDKDYLGAAPIHGRLAEAPLTANDWREVYWFYRNIVQPFLRRIVGRAYLRAGEE